MMITYASDNYKQMDGERADGSILCMSAHLEFSLSSYYRARIGVCVCVVISVVQVVSCQNEAQYQIYYTLPLCSLSRGAELLLAVCAHTRMMNSNKAFVYAFIPQGMCCWAHIPFNQNFTCILICKRRENVLSILAKRHPGLDWCFILSQSEATAASLRLPNLMLYVNISLCHKWCRHFSLIWAISPRLVESILNKKRKENVLSFI